MKVGQNFESFILNIKDLQRITLNPKSPWSTKERLDRQQKDIKNNIWKGYCVFYKDNNRNQIRVIEQIDDNRVKVRLVTASKDTYLEIDE